jgi:hypothetical protein
MGFAIVAHEFERVGLSSFTMSFPASGQVLRAGFYVEIKVVSFNLTRCFYLRSCAVYLRSGGVQTGLRLGPWFLLSRYFPCKNQRSRIRL